MRDHDHDRLRKACRKILCFGTYLELECILSSWRDDADDSEPRTAWGELITEDNRRGKPPALDLFHRGLAPPRLAGDVRLHENDRPSRRFDPPCELLSGTDRRAV